MHIYNNVISIIYIYQGLEGLEDQAWNTNPNNAMVVITIEQWLLQS